MDELTSILTAHAGRYPEMRPQDAVKLIYQNEFGGGHLITEPAHALARLRAEYAAVEHDPDAPVLEDIGNGLTRVMLAGLEPDLYPLERLNGDFVRSARLHTGSRESFLQKLALLRDLTAQGALPFSSAALTAYLRDYTAAGCPAVSHSESYRAAYHPAYRVLRRSCCPPLPVVLDAICRLPRPVGRPLIAAIDGRCAAGKTTLAGQLQAHTGCAVVHMDDFFLRPEQRSQARLAQPGGNTDHERILAEVLLPLRQGRTAVYRPFDCSACRLAAPVQVPAATLVVVEGSYSCHPALRACYDLCVFLDAAPQLQQQRLLAREGAAASEVFRTRWIPLEEAYFSAYPPAGRYDLCLESGVPSEQV